MVIDIKDMYYGYLKNSTTLISNETYRYRHEIKEFYVDTNMKRFSYRGGHCTIAREKCMHGFLQKYFREYTFESLHNFKEKYMKNTGE